MTQEHDIAAKVAELLDYGAAGIDQATADKLQAARRKALEAAAAPAHAAPLETALAGAGRYFTTHWRHPSYALTAALLLALVLLASLMMQQQHAPVEADALLLASDLPPEAYVDQGFDAWLKRSSQP